MTSYTEEEKRKAVEMVEECGGFVMHATRKSGYPSRQTLYQWLNEWVAYFATVFRLTWSIRAISDLERPGRHPSTVYHSLCPGARSSPPSFPGGLAKVTARGNHTARAAPPVPGARPSCLNCSIIRAHGARFPVSTRATS